MSLSARTLRRDRVKPSNDDLIYYADYFMRPRRIAIGVGLIVWTSFVCWDWLLHRHFAEFSTLVWIRLGFGAPWIMLLFAATFHPAARHERVASSILGLGVVGIWCALLWMIRVNSSHVGFSRYVLALALVMFFLYTLTRTRPVTAVIWGVLCLLLFNLNQYQIWLAAPNPAITEQWITTSLHLVGFICIGAVLSHQLENYFWADEHSKRRLNQQNEALEEARNTALQARRRAEAAFVEKAEFLVQASHDLRQPMQSIELLTGLLGAKQLPGEAGKLVVSLDRSVRSMDDLFRSMLDMNRLDAGTLNVRKTTFYLPAVLEDIVEQCTPIALAKGLEIRLRNAPGIWVETDATLLRRVLRNLLLNAIHYTDRGGVLLSARKLGDTICVQLWDTGIGIPRSEFKYIFRPYTRLLTIDQQRKRGLGLGLAIVKGIVDLLDIDISVESKLGKGSVFSLSLKVSTTEPEASDTSPPAPVVKMEQSLRGKLIAVVENDVDILNSVAAWLRQYEASVICATGTTALLSLVKAQPGRVDLLLADVELEGEDNAWQARDQLARELGQEVRVILMTGSVTGRHRERAEQEGVTVLQKPFPAAVLLDEVYRELSSLAKLS